jgi:hypothetical protein
MLRFLDSKMCKDEMDLSPEGGGRRRGDGGAQRRIWHGDECSARRLAKEENGEEKGDTASWGGLL